MNTANTYRPPRGCACLGLAFGAAVLGIGTLYSILNVENSEALVAITAGIAIVAALTSIASLVARTTVNERGFQMFHEPFRLRTAAFSWDDVDWWQEMQVVDTETQQARTVVEFHIRGRHWPLRVEPVGVAVPGMEAFLADIRARIGAKERPHLQNGVTPGELFR